MSSRFLPLPPKLPPLWSSSSSSSLTTTTTPPLPFFFSSTSSFLFPSPPRVSRSRSSKECNRLKVAPVVGELGEETPRPVPPTPPPSFTRYGDRVPIVVSSIPLPVGPTTKANEFRNVVILFLALPTMELPNPAPRRWDNGVAIRFTRIVRAGASARRARHVSTNAEEVEGRITTD